MVVVDFKDNLDFFKNSVPDPISFSAERVTSMELDQLSINITLLDGTVITVPERVFISKFLPLVGITGLLKKKVLENSPLYLSVNRTILELIRENLSHIMFYLDQDNRTVVTAMALLDKHQDPFEASLADCKCTNHFPVEDVDGLSVVDFDYSLGSKDLEISFIKKGSETREFFTVVHNTSSISWNPSSSYWVQRGSIYAKDFNLYLTLPRVFSSAQGYESSEFILNHLESIISQIELDQSYSVEYEEMLNDPKLPATAKAFMRDSPLPDFRLGTILSWCSKNLTNLTLAKRKAVYRYLGYLLAKKTYCCPECRHLDNSSI